MTYKITSFQWWFSNDKNAWQEGAFWNISGINFRKHTSYIELANAVTTIYNISSSNWTPVVATLWWNIWIAWRDVVVIMNTGKIFNYTSQQWTTPSWTATNAFTRSWRNYILWTNKLHILTAWSLSVFDADIYTFWVTTYYRPVLNFFWDILIGNGTSIARFNKDGTVSEYTAWVSNACIWWLDGTVYAITQIWPNVYVWCNNGNDTELYIWDWVSDNPLQKITYSDLPVANAISLWNMHYWWSKKSDYGIRTVNIWESYQPQTFIKTEYPKNPLTSNTWDDNNRMTIDVESSQYINAIESLNGIVYLPWIGCVYSFWRYYPWVWSYSLWREIKFDGTYVYAMVSGGTTTWSRDFWWMLWFVYKNVSGNYTVAVYNAWQYWENPWVSYQTTWTYESMEMLATDMYEWEDDSKLTIPCYIPDASTSIDVYGKTDQWSYSLLGTIDSSDFTWFWIKEIMKEWKWRTNQIKFVLNTTDPNYSPRVYIGVTNYTKPVWKKSSI